MTMDHRLTEMLVCPMCKGPLQLRRDEATRPVELLCPVDRLAYPIRDGIPVMLENEARHLTSEGPRETSPTFPPPGGAGPLGGGPSSAPEGA